MHIYFAGSITGGRGDQALYAKIINILKNHGNVLTEHVGDGSLSAQGEEIEAERIYQRDMEWLDRADVVVAEVTTPSLGVGYEIGAMEQKKPILCLYREQDGRKLSGMIRGNSRLSIRKYDNLSDAEDIIHTFFSELPSVSSSL